MDQVDLTPVDTLATSMIICCTVRTVDTMASDDDGYRARLARGPDIYAHVVRSVILWSLRRECRRDGSGVSDGFFSYLLLIC